MHNGCLNYRQMRQSSGGGFMVCSMVMPNGLVAVELLEAKQNSDTQTQLFKDFAVPLMNINYEAEYSVIHDTQIHKPLKSESGQQGHLTVIL